MLAPFTVALLQLADRGPLQPFLGRAGADGCEVALVLKVNVGEASQERLQRAQEFRGIHPRDAVLRQDE